MKHIDYINTDNIIITNTGYMTYQELIDDIRINKIDVVRIMEWKESSYICYKVGRSMKWWCIEHQHKKGNDFYITISIVNHTEELRLAFIPFNRDEKIDSILSQLE